MTVNPESLKNLRQFVKGDLPHHVKSNSDVSLTAALKRFLKKHPEKIDALAEAWVEQALTSPAFAREILDRVDGRLSQPVSGQLTLDHNVRFIIGKGYATE